MKHRLIEVKRFQKLAGIKENVVDKDAIDNQKEVSEKRSFLGKSGFSKLGKVKDPYDNKSDEEKEQIAINRQKTSYKQKGITCEMCERYQDAKKSGNSKEANNIRKEIIAIGKDVHKHGKEHSLWGKFSKWTREKVFGKDIEQMSSIYGKPSKGDEKKSEKHEQINNKIVVESLLRILMEEEMDAKKALDAYIKDPEKKEVAKDLAKKNLSDAPPPITPEEMSKVMNDKVFKPSGIEIQIEVPKASSGEDYTNIKPKTTVKSTGEKSNDNKEEKLQEAPVAITIAAVAPAGLELIGKFVTWLESKARDMSGGYTPAEKEEIDGLNSHKECLTKYRKIFDEQDDNELDEACQAQLESINHELQGKKSIWKLGSFFIEAGHFLHSAYLRGFIAYYEAKAMAIKKKYNYDEKQKTFAGDENGNQPSEKESRLVTSDQYRIQQAEIMYAIIWLGIAGLFALPGGGHKAIEAASWADKLKIPTAVIQQALTYVKPGMNVMDMIKSVEKST